jgi:hypothetical protein
MSSKARISLALAGAAAICAAAAGLGRAVGPIHRSTAQPEMAVMSTPQGLAVEADGNRLQLLTSTLAAERPQRLAFRILDNNGRPVTHFELEHTKRMHLILVRRDFTGFQHLHPRMRADGTWSVTTGPLAPGAYRVFTDFTTNNAMHVLGDDLFVPGQMNPKPLPKHATIATTGPYTVRLQAPPLRAGKEEALDFTVTRACHPVKLGTYLGATGHLVILRAGDLAYLHEHAETDQLSFNSILPSAGSYRAFLQFRAGGHVQTAAFTIEVQP